MKKNGAIDPKDRARIARIARTYATAYRRLVTPERPASAVADLLGLTRQAVSRWEDIGVPWQHMDALEEAYGIPRWVLSPIVYRNPQEELPRWPTYFPKWAGTATVQPAAA